MSAAGAALVLGTDAAFLEPQHPILRRIEVRLSRLPQEFDGFRIAQLSDFHYSRQFTAHPIAAAIKVVNSLTPDLVVLTGDFVTIPIAVGDQIRWPKAAREALACARMLADLRARFGNVAVLGNHDVFSDPEEVTAALQGAGIRVLRNQSFPVERGDARLWVAGLEDVVGGTADIRLTLREVPGGAATVLLCHEPDYADEVAHYPVDLQLSGHSHGGQIRLPIVGAPYLPELARKYPWGLRQIGRMMLYTNCGIGTIRIPVRWNCPPEITLFTLRAEGKNSVAPANKNG